MFQVIAHFKCTLETWSCMDLRPSAQWPGAGTAGLLAAIWRCSASSITPFSSVLLSLLVRGNSRMRNEAQLIGVNGKKASVGLQPVFQLGRTYSNLAQLPDHFRTDLKLKQVVEEIAQIAS